jgi:hypothetical protein
MPKIVLYYTIHNYSFKSGYANTISPLQNDRHRAKVMYGTFWLFTRFYSMKSIFEHRNDYMLVDFRLKSETSAQF